MNRHAVYIRTSEGRHKDGDLRYRKGDGFFVCGGLGDFILRAWELHWGDAPKDVYLTDSDKATDMAKEILQEGPSIVLGKNYNYNLREPVRVIETSVHIVDPETMRLVIGKTNTYPQADRTPTILERMDSLEAENKELSRRLDAVNKQCGACEDSLADYNDRLLKAGAVSDQHWRRIETLDGAITTINARLSALESQRAALEERLSSRGHDIHALASAVSVLQRGARKQTESGVTLPMVEKLMNEHAEKLDKHWDEIMVSKGGLNALTDQVEKLEEAVSELSTSDNFSKVTDASLRQEIKKLGAMYEDLDRRTPTAETIKAVDDRLGRMEKRLSDIEERLDQGRKEPRARDDLSELDVILWAMRNDGWVASAVAAASREMKR